MKNDETRACNPGSEVMAATGTSMTPRYDDVPLFVQDEHGALVAADAAQHWKKHAVESTIRARPRGEIFAADDIERLCGVALDANWVGGIFMRLHREGAIKKAGYRPSTKASRGGSIVTMWTAGDPA